MDLIKFQKIVSLFSEDIKKSPPFGFLNNVDIAKLREIIEIASNILPENKTFFNSLSLYQITYGSTLKILLHIYDLLIIEKESEKNIEDKKLFLSAKDKLKEAGKCFDKEDYDSVLNNLNSAVELVLKDKLNIPTTITNIHTSKIIDVLVRYNLGPIEYLKEVKKHVFLDNKVKHMGYGSAKVDCINAIKSVEELFSKLDKSDININEEIKTKIYGEV